MKKLSLEIDQLTVESFDVAPGARRPRGTVQGAITWPAPATCLNTDCDQNTCPDTCWNSCPNTCEATACYEQTCETCAATCGASCASCEETCRDMGCTTPHVLC